MKLLSQWWAALLKNKVAFRLPYLFIIIAAFALRLFSEKAALFYALLSYKYYNIFDFW